MWADDVRPYLACVIIAVNTANTTKVAIKEHCLRLLAYREHSQKELRTKLMQKGFAREDIQPIIEQLADDNWQSETRFAESYARHRMQKGYGEMAIRYELKLKGIDFALNLDGILLTVAEDWMDLLTQVYCKKYGEISPVPRVEWAKRSRFLMQRGFSSSHITQFASESRIIHF